METTTYKKNIDGDLEETTVVIIPKKDIGDMQNQIDSFQVKIDAHREQFENDIRPWQDQIDLLNTKIKAAEDHGVITAEVANEDLAK